MAGPLFIVAGMALTMALSAVFATWLVRGFHNWWITRQPKLPFACYALAMILGWFAAFFAPSYFVYRLIG